MVIGLSSVSAINILLRWLVRIGTMLLYVWQLLLYVWNYTLPSTWQMRHHFRCMSLCIWEYECIRFYVRYPVCPIFSVYKQITNDNDCGPQHVYSEGTLLDKETLLHICFVIFDGELISNTTSLAFNQYQILVRNIYPFPFNLIHVQGLLAIYGLTVYTVYHITNNWMFVVLPIYVYCASLVSTPNRNPILIAYTAQCVTGLWWH